MEKIMIFFFLIFGVIGIGLLIGFSNTGDPILLMVGVIFSFVGWLPVLFFSRKLYIQGQVQKNGIALSTEFMTIIGSQMKLNDPSGYVVRTKWFDEESNILYYFSSNTLWYNPEKELKNVKYITVLVNPKNFYHNYMDLSFLPKRFK